MVQFTYHGHDAVDLECGGKRLIIDPFLNNNPLADIQPGDVQVDYIILTHGHGDHLGDAEEIAKANDATIIAVYEDLAMYLGGRGHNVHAMHVGGGYNFEFGRMQFTVAHHGSGLAAVEGEPMLYMGDPAGVLLTVDGKKIYHAGDTGLVAEMGILGDIHNIDVALLPIGDNFTMGIDDAVYAATKLLKAKLTIPVHYNTFPVIEADPNDFVFKLAKAGGVGKVLDPGETYVVE